ncbi:MAG TPA: SLBB domain-containing protein [bacterium]|jgi:protein involved in polysaccharide export with SLBB domain
MISAWPLGRGKTPLTMLLFFSMALFTIQAGAQTGDPRVAQIREMAKNGNLSPDLLRAYGIDPSDTAAAIGRARAMGVSEEDIQKALARHDSVRTTGTPVTPTGYPENRAQRTGLETVPSVSTKSGATPADTVAKVPAVPVPQPADAQWEGLNYFGYDIFRAGKDLATPAEVGPVDPGYLVSSGDALMLTLWGEVEYQYQLEVSKEGDILIPSVGQVFVAGTELKDLKDQLRNYLSKFYAGLAGNPPTVFLDVTMSNLRGSQIYIMGEIERPGSYTLSSYATAFNAMYTIGGPKLTGSLRDVRILRDGHVTANIDLYDYLVKGLSTDDRHLLHNDIVFVPPRGKTVGISGEVNRPGVYELKEGETIQDLVSFAGKLKPTAYTFRAQIQRIVPMSQRVRGESDKKLVDIDLTADVSAQLLADGDLVMIFPILDKVENFVEITGGGVYRPGRFELSHIKTLSQLIAAADGLTPWAVTDRAEITRTYDNLTSEHLEVNPKAALSGDPAFDLTLQKRDQVHIFSMHDLVDSATVTLRGHVKKPGVYSMSDSLDLYSLLFNYAGLQDSLWQAQTFMQRGDIVRLEPDGRTRKLVPFSVRDVWQRKAAVNVKLQTKDEIVIYDAAVTEVLRREVWAYGAVNNPGLYEWKKGMSLSDLLRESGGFREDAMLLEAEVARTPPMGLKGDSLANILRVPLVDTAIDPDDLESASSAILRGETGANRFLLEPGDRIFVRSNPDCAPLGNVCVAGEVQLPGSYTLRNRNETLRDIIKRANGLKPNGYAGGGQLIRNGQRLFLNFEDLLIHGRKRENVILQPGDSIYIPTRPNVVEVKGAVMNPGYFKYVPGWKATDYVQMAGGKTEAAGKMLVQQPSGRTYECTFWSHPKPLDGAVITIYDKPPEIKGTPTDWAAIIKDSFAITASAATVMVLVKQIK